MCVNNDNKTKSIECGSWQCQRCFLCSGESWSGLPDPNKAPRCCGGEPMIPYLIPTQTNTQKDNQ